MQPSSPLDFSWRDDYSVGVAEIDEQHKRLLVLVHKLNAADSGSGIASGIARSARLMHLLDELNEYAAYHFLSEEKLMRNHLPADADTAKHISAHRSYWQIISEFKQRHAQNDPDVGHELLEYLNRWWINHIMHTDKILGVQLNAHGVR